MKLNIRSMCYRLGKTLGDINAVRRGKVGKRIARRVVGKASGKALRKMWR